MPTIVTQVNSTQGNYESIFLYTLNASLNGFEENVSSAEIEIFIPNTLNFYLGDYSKTILTYREEAVEAGKNIIFSLNSLEDLGIAIRIGFGLEFKIENENGYTFELVSNLLINGVIESQYKSEIISLVLNPRFELYREIVLPLIEPSVGGEVFFKVYIENFEDLGSKINNLVIICKENANIIIDETFPIIGKDESSSKFADFSQDGIVGTINGNEISFTIPEYRGQKYTFIYKGKISETVEIGESIVTECQWFIDSVNQEVNFHTLTLGDFVKDASLFAYGPDYTLQNQYICYEYSITNVGNQALNNVTIIETLPQENLYYEFQTGSLHFKELGIDIDSEYSIEYTTINGNSGVFGPFNGNINEKINLDFILNNNDNLSLLTWNLNALSVGITNKIPFRIKGIVKDSLLINTTIFNELTLTFLDNGEEVLKTNSKSTLVQNTCTLKPIFNQTFKNAPIKPNEIIRYTIGGNCINSRLIDPIIVFIIPKELEFIGNDSITYSDPFNVGASPILPPFTIVSNINSKGDSAIVYKFENEYSYNFKQKGVFLISFDAQVKNDSIGEFSTFMILNTLSATEFIPDSVELYRDTNDLAENVTVSPIYAKSNILSNEILFFVSVISDKKVKGLLDSAFTEKPEVGKTTPGGLIEYLITITNIGNASLEEVEIVDILPHINDTGVIQIDSPRKSQFPVYPISDINGKIISNSKIIEDNVFFEIYYSNSYDPIRFGGTFNVIGTDDNWVISSVSSLKDIKSFKLLTKNLQLKPNESLEITLKATAPTNTPTNLVAWNSFATNVSYKNMNNVTEKLLATEPEKVGIEIIDYPEGTGVINGYIWLDENKSSIPDINEEGINDVGVLLYDENGVVVGATFTTPDFNNNNGYYSFSNLKLGRYFLRFFIDKNIYGFTNSNYNNPIGSKINPKTGLSNIFELTEESVSIIANGGLIYSNAENIKLLLKVNNSAQQTLQNIIRNQLLIGMKMEDVVSLYNLNQQNK